MNIRSRSRFSARIHCNALTVDSPTNREDLIVLLRKGLDDVLVKYDMKTDVTH